MKVANQPSLFEAESDLFEGIKLTPPKTYVRSTRIPRRHERSLRRSPKTQRRLNKLKADEPSSVKIPKTYAEYKQRKADQARNEGPEIEMIGHYKPIQQNMNGYHGGSSSHSGASPRY